MLYSMTADLDWQRDLCNFRYGDLLEGRLFIVVLREIIMFI